MAFIISKTIIFFALALVLLSSIPPSYVDATSRVPLTFPAVTDIKGKVDPALERLCFSAEFPHECATAVTPFMSGKINSHSILQAGLKLIAQRSQNAIEQAEKLKKESKSVEMTGQLDFCIQKYRDISVNTKEAADALPARQFNKLESELACMVKDINECEDKFASSKDGGKSPLVGVNTSLKMAAKNNLNIGNYVAMPTSA